MRVVVRQGFYCTTNMDQFLNIVSCFKILCGCYASIDCVDIEAAQSECL